MLMMMIMPQIELTGGGKSLLSISLANAMTCAIGVHFGPSSLAERLLAIVLG
jgi:hypothetical protein